MPLKYRFLFFVILSHLCVSLAAATSAGAAATTVARAGPGGCCVVVQCCLSEETHRLTLVDHSVEFRSNKSRALMLSDGI